MEEDTTDIDAAQIEEPESLRKALLDQLRYLVEEIEALRTVVDGLPDQIKNGRPTPDALSMKELYGSIAILDSEVRRPRVTIIAENDTPAFESVDPSEKVREAEWNEHSMDDILDRVTAARKELVDHLDALPSDAWHRSATLDGDEVTLFDLVHRITQTDAERLRDLGYRLHGAHLSDGDEPLPT
ncbi:DinB family protein [Salinibacter sp. 10B]|uniref:DinB family protein n=1 Tax=Salinibacter sp. 10B TaxID=1923971 RepID=UPI0021570435|nr:DinB family protein [Salinibacter sp. 10B]